TLRYIIFKKTFPMAASKPTVSVVNPTYNCETYIAETINIVLGQTLKNLELIVVDDGSTDRTREIVASFGASVRLLSQANSGVCAARNYGIREAAGRYVSLMDLDDHWYPDKLALQVQQMEQDPDTWLVYSLCIWWHPDE